MTRTIAQLISCILVGLLTWLWIEWGLFNRSEGIVIFITTYAILPTVTEIVEDSIIDLAEKWRYRNLNPSPKMNSNWRKKSRPGLKITQGKRKR